MLSLTCAHSIKKKIAIAGLEYFFIQSAVLTEGFVHAPLQLKSNNSRVCLYKLFYEAPKAYL